MHAFFSSQAVRQAATYAVFFLTTLAGSPRCGDAQSAGHLEEVARCVVLLLTVIKPCSGADDTATVTRCNGRRSAGRHFWFAPLKAADDVVYNAR